MFEPTEREFDRDVERSMELFKRAQVGPAPPLAIRRPQRVLLALDASSQDESGLSLANRLKQRFDCACFVVDARENGVSNELADQIAASLDGEALAKTEGESYEQILTAIEGSNCDLAIVPCPYGRTWEKIGVDSVGTIIDVLLARSPVPLLIVRRPLQSPADPFQRLVMVLIGENQAAPAAAAWAAGLASPSGKMELALVLEQEVYENVRDLLHALDPQHEATPEALIQALQKSHAHTHCRLEKTAAEHGFAYHMTSLHEADQRVRELEEGDSPLLLVLPLEPSDHASQSHVDDRIRHTVHPVLVTPHLS